MFEFVYKMFGEGFAVIPKNGIEAIAQQLATNLKGSIFRYNTLVKTVKDGKIVLDDGTELPSDITIVATEPNNVIENLETKQFSGNRVIIFTFRLKIVPVNGSLIGLVADEDTLITNVVNISELHQIQEKTSVLSITVLQDKDLKKDQLVKAVEQELIEKLGVANPKLLADYKIVQALPDITNVQDAVDPKTLRLTTTIFVAGDTQLNGSLNGAMQSGELAAKGVMELLEDSPDLAQFTSEYL